MFRTNLIKLVRSTVLNKQFVSQQLQCTRNSLKLTHNNINIPCCKCITSKADANKLSEEEYLVKVKNDPDTFGGGIEKTIFDEDDEKEETFLQNKPLSTQKLTTKQYGDKIKDFIRKKKIKEAIDYVEVKMIQEDRVKPDNYIFNLILGACGRVGYTKKAFSLYNQMKQRGLKITGGTYTALFNACANSPWPEDGLTRAKHLREIMIEKRDEPNDTNYNVMIKAFGRCGDLNTAFELVDEMASKRIPIGVDTLNFLLQTCVSEKEAGFRHALLVWRKFYQKKLTPDIFSFNLLLKCTKECKLGDLEVTKDVIDTVLNRNAQLDNSKLLLLNEPNFSPNEPNFSPNDANLEIESSLEKTNLQNDVSLTESNSNDVSYRPNLIAKTPHLGNIISLNEVNTPEDRFLLIGGLSGFLQTMTQNHCVPNIKTFTQMLDLIPGTLVAEKELMGAMKKANVNPDADFYNMLMKKRSIRFDYRNAKDVLLIMKEINIKPNIITYGILALGCKTKEEAEEFMTDMKNDGCRMNAEILGAMLHQACHHYNFKYVLMIMETCITEEIRPNAKFMTCLEEFKKKCRRLSNDKESIQGQSKAFNSHFIIFKMRYKVWKTKVDPINEDEHPWQQFRQVNKTDVRYLKDKEQSSRFKARHNSLYKQKKGVVAEKKVKSSAIRSKDTKNMVELPQQRFIEDS